MNWYLLDGLWNVCHVFQASICFRQLLQLIAIVLVKIGKIIQLECLMLCRDSYKSKKETPVNFIAALTFLFKSLFPKEKN